MLRITYTDPAKVTHRWLFDPDEVDMAEAERIEQALGEGQTWDYFVDGLLRNVVAVRRVLLWHLLRRANPDYDMPLYDVPNIKMGQLRVELGSAEIVQLISDFKASAMPVARRRRAISDLEVELGHAQAAEAAILTADVEADPKGPPTEDAGTIPDVAVPVDPPVPETSETSETTS